MSSVWVTREGKEIKVEEMTDAHRRNTLKMMIRKYTIELIHELGARHTSGIDVDAMSESDVQELLDNTIRDKRHLKKMVANGCLQTTLSLDK